METSTIKINDYFAKNDQNIFVVSQEDFYKATKLFLGELQPYIASYPEEVFLAFLSPSDQSRFKFSTSGWTVNISEGFLKLAFTTSTLAGILVTLGYSEIPGILLPTILPFLFEIEKSKLTKKEEIVLGELYVKDVVKKEFNSEEIYNSLPSEIKEQITVLDFYDFLEKFHITGFLNKKENDLYSFNPKESPKFRITFK